MASKNVQKARTVSYEKALWYAIFLGWIGVDRFYIGDTRRGILKAFTLSVGGFFWIVDILIIRSHKDNWDEWIRVKQAKNVEAQAVIERQKEAQRIHDELASNGQCPRCKSTNLTAVSETTNKLSGPAALYQLSDLTKFVSRDKIVSVIKRVCLNCGYKF